MHGEDVLNKFMSSLHINSGQVSELLNNAGIAVRTSKSSPLSPTLVACCNAVFDRVIQLASSFSRPAYFLFLVI